MRRILVVSAAVALCSSLFAAPVAAAPSPQGILQASFQAYWTGGAADSWVTWRAEHPGESWWHAANTAIDWAPTGYRYGAVRLGVYPGEEFCSNNVFGIWVLWWDNSETNIANATYTMSFGPQGGTLTPLLIQMTPVKPAVDPQGWVWGGIPTWWRSVGVPVYGFLAPGIYTMHWTETDALYGFSEGDATYTIDAC